VGKIKSGGGGKKEERDDNERFWLGLKDFLHAVFCSFGPAEAWSRVESLLSGTIILMDLV
jgi:hypothetical protein